MSTLEFCQLIETLSIEEITEIPNKVLDAMLSAGADVGKDALQREIRSLGLVKTEQFVTSLVKRVKVGKDGRPFYMVYPTGKRREDTGGGTNNLVGLVHEFGDAKRGIPAKQWARTAIEKCADDVLAAELKVYDEYLKNRRE